MWCERFCAARAYTLVLRVIRILSFALGAYNDAGLLSVSVCKCAMVLGCWCCYWCYWCCWCIFYVWLLTRIALSSAASSIRSELYLCVYNIATEHRTHIHIRMHTLSTLGRVKTTRSQHDNQDVFYHLFFSFCFFFNLEILFRFSTF